MAPKKSARTATVDPVLDRRLVSTAEGALPVHSRISVKLGKTWENGLVTQTWNTLGPTGRPLIMYKIAYDNGKEQECDLSVQDARLITSHAADTPRLQRKASYIDPRDLAHDQPVLRALRAVVILEDKATGLSEVFLDVSAIYVKDHLARVFKVF